MWFFLLLMTFFVPIAQIVLGQRFKTKYAAAKAEAAKAEAEPSEPEKKAAEAERIMARVWTLCGIAGLVISLIVMLIFRNAELKTAGLVSVILIVLQFASFLLPYIPIYRMFK